MEFSKVLKMRKSIRGYKPEQITKEELENLTAEVVCNAAKAGDALACRIMEQCGTMLGVGLSVVMDILNPERIIIGSIFSRAGDLLWPAASKVIEVETLEQTRSACRVVPSELSESVGDIAALTVADYYWNKEHKNETGN